MEENIAYAVLNEIKNRKTDGRLIVAIDGRCASGKTTLAKRLKELIDCTIFSMDDFFLREEQRTEERLKTPGGNVDYERFLREILLPLKNNAETLNYSKYNCKTGRLLKAPTKKCGDILIVEGSYSCHPKLASFYGLKIFLSVSKEEQLRRIKDRNSESEAERFKEKWIPLEELYFDAYKIQEHCDLCFKTD